MACIVLHTWMLRITPRKKCRSLRSHWALIHSAEKSWESPMHSTGESHRVTGAKDHRRLHGPTIKPRRVSQGFSIGEANPTKRSRWRLWRRVAR